MTDDDGYRPVLQDWVCRLSLMKQAVLLASVRGPDGVAKEHPSKNIVRWYRRCILISAFDNRPINDPYDPGGGSFTGPSCSKGNLPALTWQTLMTRNFDKFLETRDELNLHYYQHFMHSIQIVGADHTDHEIRDWWSTCYSRMVDVLHLKPESDIELGLRLGDREDEWRKRSDPSELQ